MKSHAGSGEDRRQFLKSCSCMLAGVAVSGVSTIIAGCEFTHISDTGAASTDVEIDVSSLVADRTGLKARRGAAGTILVIRMAPGEFRAMSAICPHTGSFAVSLPENDTMTCPGHDSQFDLTGRAISGEAIPYGGLKQYRSRYDAARKVLVVTIAS